MDPANVPTDIFSTQLIPPDIPESEPSHRYRAAQSTGNGNCLFNSASILLSGNEEMASILREAVARELRGHGDVYHRELAKFQNVPIEVILHTILPSDVLMGNTLHDAWDKELLRAGQNCHWSSILHVMGLATVLCRPIVSVFPKVPYGLRSLYHRIVSPVRNAKTPELVGRRITVVSPKLVILWTRDGTLDANAVYFEPNHVVPLLPVELVQQVSACSVQTQQSEINVDLPSIQSSHPNHVVPLLPVELVQQVSACSVQTQQSEINVDLPNHDVDLPSIQSSHPNHVVPLLPVELVQQVSACSVQTQQSEIHVDLPNHDVDLPSIQSSHPNHVVDLPSIQSSHPRKRKQVKVSSGAVAKQAKIFEFFGGSKKELQSGQSAPSLRYSGHDGPFEATITEQTEVVSNQLEQESGLNPDQDKSDGDDHLASDASPAPFGHIQDSDIQQDSVCVIIDQEEGQEPSEKPTKPDHSNVPTVPLPPNIKSRWFMQYPWLRYENNLFYCASCVQTKKVNVFTKGKEAIAPKKDDFTKHAKSKDHVHSLKQDAESKSFKKAVSKSFDLAQASITAQLATLYTMAKACIATNKLSHLIRLQIFNGVSVLSSLSKDERAAYSHSDSTTEMYNSMFDVVLDESNLSFEESPYHVYGLEIDELTDVSNKSVVIMYMRYVGANGKVQNKFLKVKELQQTNADSIYEAVQAAQLERSLDTDGQIVAVATDGASVMVGIHKGVAAHLGRDHPHLIKTHCMAHRLQLAGEKAAGKVPYIIKFIDMLNLFARSLKFSPKLTRILETSQQITGERTRKIKEVFFTRWLSFGDSVQALCGSISSIIWALNAAAAERGLESRAVLSGLAVQMADVRFVLMAHFLADVVGLLNKLSKVMQQKSVQYSTIKAVTDATLEAIRSSLEHPGENMKQLMLLLPKDADPSGTVRLRANDHELKDSEKKRADFKKAAEQYIEELILQLEFRFPDSKIISAFSIFSPKQAPPCETTRSDFLNTLLDRYSSVGINRDDCLTEWDLVKYVVPKYQTCDMEQFMEKFIHPSRETFPNISRLIAIGLSIPVTSVECERGVSLLNQIKDASRGRLSTEMVNKLMHLNIEGQELEEFDFDNAFKKWFETRERRAFQTLVKSINK